MSVSMLIFWGLVGWCGTPWPLRWPPPPPPPPTFRWFVSRLVGVVGGIAGGWIVNGTLLVQEVPGAIASTVIATGLGALVGSIFLQDVVGGLFVGPQPEPPRV